MTLAPLPDRARASVAVVITCYNQSAFLPEAVESALSQHPEPRVLVVDDGSSDDTRAVAATFPRVEYVYQRNRGLSAARNTGLRMCREDFVVFLDADDRLCPGGLAANLGAIAPDPELAFVYGAFRAITATGTPIYTMGRDHGGESPYTALLRRNHIGMHGSVMYRRRFLEGAGAFDETLDACEDYDVFLRLARLHRVAWHQTSVADYRQHSKAMSNNALLMLRSSLFVLRRQRPFTRADARNRAAYRDGLRQWREYYGSRLRREALQCLRRRRHRSRGVALWLAGFRLAPLEMFRSGTAYGGENGQS